MLTFKLQRIGKKKEPHFRLIVQEKGKDPHDKSVEILGWLNPRTKEKELKKERIEYWLSVGAQATDTVHNLLVSENILKADKKKTFKISKKRASKKKGKQEKEEK
ncbi:30S ribosomal protein S16 [Candidatus Parcubacteria bacterium]|nr:30S ribosomal protein S16 [Patescibacteria group bacterium]MBU4482106.1 30S ribosomal protein S16 [Patescibacteria group bacterium]MCG2687038.1 30S ribosomal protein S16 [Candidatus Parcubacteria bacterium]